MNIIDTIINAIIIYTVNIGLFTATAIIIWKTCKSKIKRLIAKAIEEILWGSND